MPTSKNPYERANLDHTVVDHEDRVRKLERIRDACGPWYNVGDPDAPAFENGWHNSGGGLVVARYRKLYPCGMEIQASITGGAYGTVAWTFPDAGEGWRPDSEIRLVGCDDLFEVIIFRILADGSVIPEQAAP